jgi:hypothetical protein
LRSHEALAAEGDPFRVAAEAYLSGRPLRRLEPGKRGLNIKRRGSAADTLQRGFPACCDDVIGKWNPV